MITYFKFLVRTVYDRTGNAEVNQGILIIAGPLGESDLKNKLDSIKLHMKSLLSQAQCNVLHRT